MTTILQNILYLKRDFIGLTFNVSGFLHFLYIWLISLGMYAVMYLLGRKVVKRFFEKIDDTLGIFAAIALGYILLCSGVAILGTFSWLYPQVLMLYLLLIALICVIPLSSFKESVDDIFFQAKQGVRALKKDRLMVLLICGFVSIAFLRLIPPDIGADALDYHTSFPRLYLKEHSMMLTPEGNEISINIPQLGEMPYVLTDFLGAREASKIVHFLFFVIVTLLLLYIGFSKRFGRVGKYASLFFVSSPLVLHIAASAYSDFQTVFCFFVAFFLLGEKRTSSRGTIILAGLVFGGMLATKLWALALYPILVLYISWCEWEESKSLQNILIQATYFTIAAFLVPLLWYIRSYVLLGDPIYYNIDYTKEHFTHNHVVEFARDIMAFSQKIRKEFLSDYSPLFFLGFISLPFTFRYTLRSVFKLPFGILLLVLLVLYILVPERLFDARYIMFYMILLMLVIAVSVLFFLENHRFLSFVYFGFAAVLLMYFAINTLLILPYGLGFANTDAYLSRVLANTPGSYYDYHHLFSPHIKSNETVATYNIALYYYATFAYKNVYYFMDNPRTFFSDIRKDHINKLLLRGGNFTYFCKQTQLDCKNIYVTLLAEYLPAQQYLYKIDY